MAETCVFFDSFFDEMGDGTHDFDAGGDVIKVFLNSDAPVVGTDTVKGDLTEVTDSTIGAGGGDISNAASSAAGVCTVTGSAVTFEASGESIGPFSYVSLYNSSKTDKLVCYWAATGAPVTLADGETYTWKPSNQDTGGTVLTIQETA